MIVLTNEPSGATHAKLMAGRMSDGEFNIQLVQGTLNEQDEFVPAGSRYRAVLTISQLDSLDMTNGFMAGLEALLCSSEEVFGTVAADAPTALRRHPPRDKDSSPNRKGRKLGQPKQK